MSQKKKYGIVGVLAIILLLGFTSKDNRFQYIFNRLDKYVEEESPEKIYLHTDKQYYTSGETIWFKSYLLNGISHIPNTQSKVSYVELISPKDSILARRTLYSDELGGAGDIVVAPEWESGTYLLRSYTNYMRNDSAKRFFQKEIPIWKQKIAEHEINQSSLNSVLPDSLGQVIQVNRQNIKTMVPKIKVYPEGGYLIANMKNTIGIHATDDFGNGVEVMGSIKDSKGKHVEFFRTYKYGLGKVSFLPKKNETYVLSVKLDGKEKQYPFPEIKENGYRLGVRNVGEKIVIDVESTEKNGLYQSLLIGHLRGKTFFKHIESKGTNRYALELLIKELDDGVAHFTLFTPSGEPVCERLTFVDNSYNDVAIDIKTNKINFDKRERVEIDIDVTDNQGGIVKGDFSMSVVSSDSLDFYSETSDIRSWLLLDSDLKGTIENPGYFFEKDEKGFNKKFLLDALMLTHGWRRFVWKDFLKMGNKRKDLFDPEKGIFINGKTTDYQKPFATKPTKTSITFLEKGIYEEQKETDSKGRFSYGPFFFRDTVQTVIEAEFPQETKEKKRKNISIFVDPPLPSPPVDRLDRIGNNQVNEVYIKQYLSEARRQKISDYLYNPEATTLDEVVLTVKKKSLADKIAEEHGYAQNRLIVDSLPGAATSTIIDLLRQIPIVNIVGAVPSLQIYVRELGGTTRIGTQSPAEGLDNDGFSIISDVTNPEFNSGALILIDEAEVSIGFIDQMWASEVLFIDVLRPSEAFEYGSRGAQGVIRIFTKRGTDFIKNIEQLPGITNFKMAGFYKTREFFAPDYSKKAPEHYIPDYRSTLHWEPYVINRKNEKSRIKFYTSDNEGKYLIKIEGVTEDGRVVKRTQEIEIGA